MRTGVNVLATAALAASIATMWGGPALAQETIKMGALATLEGAFAVLGEDSMRGVRLALEEFNYTAGGKKIELITGRSEEHTSELQSLMRISYAVFCLKKKK